MDMPKLTPKQEEFARLVGMKDLSQSDAYRQAYGRHDAQPERIHTLASALAALAKVANRIEFYRSKRRDVAIRAASISIKELMARYVAIALVDPNELISHRVGACRHCWSVDHQYHWKAHEYMAAVEEWERKSARLKPDDVPPCPDPSGGLDYRFSVAPNPACPQCEGEGLSRVVPQDTTTLSEGARALYRGLQQTKDGVRIKFADQDAALEKIGRMLGAFDDRLRVDLDGKIAELRLTTTDPAEAADAYKRMVAGGS